MTHYTFKSPSTAKAARLARRRLVVRVRSLALAAAVALGAVSPALLAQTVITPLTGAGQTATVVSTQGNQTVVNTQSLRDGNAFSTYSAFQVGQGDTVKLAVPQGANWWVNIVRDARVRVDGRLESRLTDGSIGGNILFVDSHGFTVGPNGQVDVGRLGFAAPSTTFVNGLLAGGGTLSGAAVSGLLGGAFERSATGDVDIQGRVTAKDGVSIMAGQGGPGGLGVTLSGQVVLQGRVAGSAVNLGDLKSLAPLEDHDGVIDITTPGSITLDGMLISDSAQFTRAGAVRVVAGGDIAVGAQTLVSASGAAGSGQAGGQVTLFAHGNASNAVGATLAARGDGFGAGGFIELSAAQSVQIGGLTLDASSDKGQSGLAYIDPEDLVVSGSLYTNGAALSLDATKTLKVNTAVTLNTRRVTSDAASAGGVAAAATAITNNASTPSLGNSGNITLEAPSITVAAGAVLDASVVNTGGTTFAAGDISLIAKQSSNWATFVSLSDANASITVAGTLLARDIDMLASIESKAVFGGAAGSMQQGIVDIGLSLLQSPLALTLAYVQATGNARVTLASTADVQASRDLSITAKADRYVGAEQAVEGSSSANLGAGFARVKGTTEVEVQSGANLFAGHDLSLLAASKTKVLMNSTAMGKTDATTGAANVASIIFAGSLSDVTTTVTVGSGAELSSGNDLNLQSYHSGQYNTAAEVKVYGSGTAGVVGALSLQKSDTRTTFNGQASAGGEARMTALNFVSKSAVSAKSQNTSEKPPAFVPPATLETSNAEAQKGLMDVFMVMAGAFAEAQQAATGNTSSASTPELRMAGALAWAEADHTTRATLGAGARLVATGNAIIDAQTLAGAVQGTAMAEATSKVSGAEASATSLSVAFNYNNNNFDTQARVGSNATLTGLNVAVSANTDMPEFYTEGIPMTADTWDDPFKVYANLVGGLNPLFDGFNTRVAARSAAENLAASGAVSLSFNNNNTVAWVDTGAQVSATSLSDAGWNYNTNEVYFNSDVEPVLIGAEAYRLDKKIRVIEEFAKETREFRYDDYLGASQVLMLDEIEIGHEFSSSLVVKAQNHVQTLHAAGGEAPEGGANGTAVGGTFTLVDRNNTAISGIADQAVVNARSLSVLAQNKDWLLSVSATAGAGDGVAANAMVSYNKLNETALASISREAQVTVAKEAEVKAELTLWGYGITGAVTKSTNSGVGVGLAINEFNANTKAYIGDNDSDAGGSDTTEGAAGFVKTAQLDVLATSTGNIGAVGVAGAMAGGTPKPGLANKAGSKSAGAQSQLDGNDSSMAPLEESSEPAKGSGSDQAAADAPAANKPPSFSIAGAGAIVTNYSNLDTTALIDGAVIQAIGAGTSTVAVRALSDVTQVSAAGGGALSMSKNAATTFTAAVAGAVAIQDSDDDTTARIVDSTVSDLADQAGSLVVQALKSGERTAVATGISANLSKGSTTSLSLVGAASVTTTTDDTLASMANSTVTGNVASPAALGVQVAAYDRTRIGAGGGALSVSTGKGASSVGAVISIVNAKGSTQAQVSGGSVTQAHDLAVLALSSQKVVGVGAVAGVQTSNDATSLGQMLGSFVFNYIDNTLSAGVKGGAVVNLTGDLALQAGGAPTGATLDALLGAVRASDVIDYEMTSTSNGYTSELKSAVGGESIVGVAGTLGMTMGSNSSSLGLSYVHNDIETSYDAELNGNITTLGGVSVQALSRADIVGVAVGMGATKGKFSGMGSASVNLIGQRTQAMVTGGSVTASGLTVNSETLGNQFGLAGNLSIAVGGGSGNAAGAAVSYTLSAGRDYQVGNDLSSIRAAGNQASVSNATVNVATGDVIVSARHTSDTQSVAASGVAADGNVGFAGTMAFTDVGGTTNAVVDNSDLTAGTVSVTAGEAADGRTARSLSVAGGVAASKSYAGALSVAWNTMSSARTAKITNSDLVVANAVTVESAAQGAIETLAVAVSAGKDGADAGSIANNFMISDTSAEFSGGSLSGTATSLTVRSTGSASIESLAGAVSGAGTAAAGGALSVNSVGEDLDNFRVRTRLADTTLSAPVAVTVESSLAGSIDAIAASGSGAGTLAVNGSVTVNTIEADVSTEVSGVIQSTNGGAFKVHANNDADIASLAGTVSGAGTAAVGVAVSVNEIGGHVKASVADSTLRATGAVEVDATTSGTIKSVAAGMAGGGTAAAAGSNTTNVITSTVLAQMSNVTQAAASASLRVQAHDSSLIQSFAGTVAGGGTAAGGAAFSQNILGLRPDVNANSSKVVKAQVLNSTLNSGGAVQVRALSTSTIESMAMAIGGSGNAAVTGSNTINLLDDDIIATWSGGSLNGTATSLTVQADDAAAVRTLAGNVSGSAAGAFGAAIAVNQVGSSVHATLSGMSLGAPAAVLVDADLRGEIESVAASGAADGAVSVNGSFTTNEVNASVKAQALGLTQTSNGGAFTVSADNDADILSIAGTVSGSGGAAAGVAVSVNEIGGDVTARLQNSTLRAAGAVNVQATTSGAIKSVAAGMAGGGSAALAGSNTTNAITSTVLAQMDAVNMAINAASLTVLARDTSTIQSFAGTVTGGGAAAGGAALALNFLGRTTTNADSSKVVKAEVLDSIVRSIGAVQVNAYSSSVIESIGVAAGASGTAAINGSNATNLLEDEITASWLGSDLISANTLTVSARQAAEIDSLAGNVSGSGGVAVGAALAVNRIGTQTNASLVGVTTTNYNNGVGHWTQNADDLVLSAESDNQINTLAVGMSAGAVGVQGSVAVSVIESQTRATLGADGYVTNVIAADSVAVTANSHDRIRAFAGAIGFGAVGLGAAGGLLTNIIASDTSAGIDGLDTHVNAKANGAGLTVKADSLANSPDLMNISAVSDSVLDGASYTTRTVKGLAVQATSIQQIGAVTSVASGAVPAGVGSTGVGASVNVDQIGGSTRAYIESARFINTDAGMAAAQTVDVMAANHAMIASSTSALAVGDVGVSGAIGTALINRSTRAEVLDQAVVKAAGAVSVNARSTNTVALISVGYAGGTYAGVAGSGDVALQNSETVARVDHSTIEAGSVSVLAEGANRSNLIAGSVGSSAGVGAGLSFSTNVSGSVVRALVMDSLVRADGAVLVHADNTTEELAVAATAGNGGMVGAAIGAAVTVLEGQTEANVGGTSRVERRTRATGVVASSNNAGVTVVLDGADGTVTANEQGATRFVLMTPATVIDGETVPAAVASLGGGALMKVSDGTREVTATRNADGSYTANLSSLGDGQLTALIYTASTNGVPDAGSLSSRLLFTKAAGVGSLSVAANEHISIDHNAGGIGVGGVAGVGAAANVVIGRSSVLANASGSALTVGGALSVVAAREADVAMITATGGGGGQVGVSGAVGVLLFGAAPDSTSTSELNNGNGSSVAKVSSATESDKAGGSGSGLTADEQTSLNSGASYDTAAAFNGASGLHSTAATVAATSISAGSVTVSSTDRTEVNNSAGAIAAGGAAGVSAGVAVTILGGANNASVSATSLDSQGAISIDAGTRAPSAGGASVQSRAIAGAGGFVGVGAAVSVARNQTANSAALSGQVHATGAVSVQALDQASMSSDAFGATVGAVSVGVVVATADQSGSVTTQVAGSVAAQGVALGAERQASVTAMAVGGSAGVAAGSGAGATASDSGLVQVNLASGLALDAGDGQLNISAKASPKASSDAIGVAVGLGGAVGISIAESSVDADVSVNSLGTLTLKGQSVNVSAVLGADDALVDSFASAGAGGLLLGGTGASASSRNNGSARVNLAQATALRTAGDAGFSATDAMTVTSNAVGIGAGFVGVGVAVAQSVSNTSVDASASNLVGSVGGSLNVSASGNESISGDATAGSGGVVSGAGANSTVTHTQTVNAQLGGDLLVGGMTMVDATRTVRYDSHTTAVNASAVGASGAVTRATLTGSASAALLNATVLNANSLRVLATNDLARNNLSRQSAEGGGGGVISGAGAEVTTVLSGTANATMGNGVNVTLEKLLELRAYNETHGSALARMDVGGAIPIALVSTRITSNADANASIGSASTVNSYGESHVDALSYIDIEANSISKTYGLAAAAQGNSYATANVNNRVNLGAGTVLRSAEDVSLLAGQDRDFNRNKSFVTARTDLFNHSAIPVSINPDADATLNLTNAVTVDATAVRSGGTIRVGAVEGSLVVDGNGNVSDWTRDLGELMGISSSYGKSDKNINNTAALKGAFEAGYGNKQRLVIDANGSIVESVGDVRYTITNEDLSASASAYVSRLYDQLARYGDVPEVKAFVQAELSFYFANLLKEGLAEKMEDGTIVPIEGVAANFLNIKDLRAGSGNIELFGDNVTGTASLTARADSEIYIENRSPLNLRVYNMVVDANGGFAKYNGTYLTSSADIAALNTSVKSTGLGVDSIDTRGGGASQQLPTLTVKNTYTPLGVSDTAVVVTAPDGTFADLREDQMRAPEIRVNGTLYNKLGTVNLSNTAGSISVYAEDPAYTPRLDGKEITVTAGKNFVLSSPSISQSVGGSPESLYAVAYSDDQQRILDNLGITACGSARPGESGATSYNANCVVNGAGGVYASGAIFIGARYLNINGTVQSGQPDYNVVLNSATVSTTINAWQTKWDANRGRYLAQGKSSLIQVTGPLPTDSEAEINKQFANGAITAAQRTTKLNAMAARRLQPIVYFDAETKRLKVAATNVTGGLVELIGTIINTGGGVVRALDGYAHINIDNQTSYGMDLLGLNTGGEAGMVRITDMGKPVYTNGAISDYQTTTYQRDADGVFRATVTAGRGIGATVIGTPGLSSAAPSGSVKAQFTYNPVADSTYSWSAGYEYTTEKRYWYQKSAYLGFINGGSVSWNNIDTYVKTANAMAEDVFVSTTQPVGGGNFSLQSRRFLTDAEVETYYRSWKKCGFLCIKKTYYVDRRTEVGYKDVFTQRVAADHPINIQLVGYDTGLLNVTSVGDIRLGGDITNNSGAVTLTSSNGAIYQLNSGATVSGVDLSFTAKTGIGTAAAPINLVTGSGSFTAVSNSGDIAFHGNSGALRINRVATAGNVWLDGDDSIVGLNPNAVHVSGNRIYLSAPTGGIGEFNADGSVKSTLNIQTTDSPNGGLSAYAREGIAIKQPTGNLWIDQVVSGGDVYLQSGGDLIDNNRNETRDERTETELLSLWDQAALQGDSAEASRQLTLTTTRAQFQRYWSLRGVSDVVTDASGNVTSYVAPEIDSATYQYQFSTEERQNYLNTGVTEAQLASIETARTEEVLQLHAQFGGTKYQTGNNQIIASVNADNALSGKAEVGALAEWSDAELKSPLPKAVFSKSSTDTQTRIEEPNVVGNRVVLRPGGQVGRDDGTLTIPLLQATRLNLGLSAELSADERLAIMAAESADMTLDRTNWTLSVLKKDNFNVLSNRLNVSSNGFIYLGADATDAYPNGGTANLEQITGTGEVRIQVMDSILNVADAGISVIQGQKAVLEAAQGSIGTALKPIQIALANNSTGTLTARASEGLWIHEIGDMRAADIYTPGLASLSATGAIIDARPVVNYPNEGDRTVRAIEANALTLDAQRGAIGSGSNPLVVKVGSGGVNATTPRGYSIFLSAAEGAGMTLKTVDSGLDVRALSSYGNLYNLDAVTALGSIDAQAFGDITGVDFTAGSTVVIGAGGGIAGDKVTAIGVVTITAGEGVSLNSLQSSRDASITADGASSVNSASAGGDLSLVSTAGGFSGIAWMAGGSLLARAGGGAGDISVTSVSATKGGVDMEVGGRLVLDTASALGNVRLQADRDLALLNVASKNGTLWLGAGDALSLLSGSSRGDVSLAAGAGIEALTLSSAAGLIDVAASAGNVSVEAASAKSGLVFGAVLGNLNLGALKTASGNLTLTSGAAMQVTSVSLPGNILATAGTSADFGTLTSSAGSIDLTASQGTLQVGRLSVKNDFSADATHGDLLLDAFTATTAALHAGNNLRGTGAVATRGDLTISSDGNAELDVLSSSAGSIGVDALGSLSVATARAAKAVTLSSGTDLTADTLLSSSANIGATSGSGLVTLSKVSAKTGFVADVQNGDLVLGSFTAGSANLTASGMVQATGTGTTVGDMLIASGGNAALASLSSSSGAITADAGGTLTVSMAKASQAIDLSAASGLTAGTLQSSGANIAVDTTSGLLQVASLNARTTLVANAVGGDLTLGSFKAASADLHAGRDLMATGSGVTSGEMVIVSGGDARLASLSSSSGGVSADAGGTLTVATVKAAGTVDVSGDDGLYASTLSSSRADVKANSVGGSVVVKSATARTNFAANSSGNLDVSSFTVSAGGALLQSGGTTMLGKGVATGNMDITSVGNADLGSLSTSTGWIHATSTGGGLSFDTLSARTGISLTAARAWSAGNAIAGTSLLVSNGGLDLLATSGAMSFGTLSATAPSKLKTTAGAIKVGRVVRLTPAQLTVDVNGGAKSLPRYY